MTITLQAVNELIASLESAGELSIREQKFLKLAKAFKQLAAENVALKAGVTYFAYSPEYGFDYFKDKQSAIDTAQAEIDAYREDADDGWSEDVQRVSWGIVIQQAQGFDAQGLHTSDSQHTYQTCNYRLVDSVETPATDRIVAGIKADGASAAGDYLKQEAQHMPVVERLMMQDAAEICYGTAARLREGGNGE
ncbi:TPA: hypothetical protein R4X16_000556 [Klebsiella variicola subsp. variicola]|uniref:hypothetical protein n=1 Tax=Klebsiella TaxID=570 RepID=UPI001660D9DF|nr:hypothetical protein [Klebsiella variicola]MBD0721441.1 hypothetical protein [Klebsiella variicola]HED1709640.1 hypothetical protein [Klebsiella variicola subsp. variicola]